MIKLELPMSTRVRPLSASTVRERDLKKKKKKLETSLKCVIWVHLGKFSF